MRTLDDLSQADGWRRSGEFAALVRCLAAGRGVRQNALGIAEGSRAPERIQRILKSPLAAAGSGSWGSELADYRQISAAFLDALRTTSVFYRLLGDNAMVKLPFAVRVGAIASGAIGTVVEPGQAIPVSKLELRDATLSRRTAAGLLVLSQELLDTGQAVESLISRSLRASVSQAVDIEFLSVLTADITPAGATDSPLADLRQLLNAVTIGEGSRLYWLANPTTAIMLSTYGAAGSAGSPPAPTGQRVFPEVTPLGGMLLGLPLLVSSAVSAATLILCDASGIGAASDPVDLAISRQAAIQLGDSPTMSAGAGSPDTPIGTETTSMFQTNSVAIRCVAPFGCAWMRAPAGSIAAMGSIPW